MRALTPEDFARLLISEQLGAEEQARRDAVLSARADQTPNRNTKGGPPQLSSDNQTPKECDSANKLNKKKQLCAQKGSVARRRRHMIYFQNKDKIARIFPRCSLGRVISIGVSLYSSWKFRSRNID